MKKVEKKPARSRELVVTCRFVEKADVRGLAKLHSEAFGARSDRALETANEHCGQRSDKGAVVAVAGKTIVGYALFTIQDKDMSISHVGVKKANRGQGVCGRIIPWLLRRLACFDCQTASLIVVSDTDAALKCYKSQGFVGDDSSLTYRPKRPRN